MKPILAALPIVFFIISCTTKKDEVVIAEPSPIDSFTVSGIDIGQQAQDFRYLNDTTLCAYDPMEMRLVHFHKNTSGNYQASVKKDIDAIFMSSYFIDDDYNNYFISQDKYMVIYNPSADSLLWKTTFHYNFKHLKDTFGVFSTNNTPFIKRGDTLIAAIAHGSIENYKNYFKEQEIAEFKLDRTKDTVAFLRSYIDKPASILDDQDPFPFYCFLNNSIHLIYPSIDTLYSFNRTSNKTTKIHINNRDYKLPETCDCKNFTPDYGSCMTKYVLHNFGYRSIRYNPITRHYILFYKASVSDTIKNRVPTHDDQPLRALVLDEQFKEINYLVFRKKFISPMSFFFIPGKGFAMPIFKGTDAYETTRFYIYNL